MNLEPNIEPIEIKTYTIVTEIPGDLPADQIPTPSLDGAEWLLRGQHDGLQLTTEEAKRWMKENTDTGLGDQDEVA